MKRVVLGGAIVALAASMLAVGLLWPRAIGAGARQPTPAVSPAAFGDPFVGSAALQRSIASLQVRLHNNPRDWQSLAVLGLDYLQQARATVDPSYYTKAAALFRRSIALDSRHNYAGWLGKAILAGAQHKFADALDFGRKARAINPYSADVRGVIADAFVELGRYGDAERDLQKMVDLRPGLPSYSRISYFRELHGDLPGAIQAMTMALDAGGGSGEDAAWASYQLGDLFLMEGRVRRASFFYRKGAYLAPDYFLPKVGLAKIAYARGETSKAIATLTSVVRQYPLPTYVMMLGDLYRASGKHALAAREYKLVLAEQKLFQANGVVPDTEIMVFNADHGLKLHETLKQARVQYRIRSSVRVADALSWVLYANRDYTEAAKYSRRALRLGTKDSTYYFHAGMIAKAVGDAARARRYLTFAVRTNPHFSIRYAPQAVAALHHLGALRQGPR